MSKFYGEITRYGSENFSSKPNTNAPSISIFVDELDAALRLNVKKSPAELEKNV